MSLAGSSHAQALLLVGFVGIVACTAARVFARSKKGSGAAVNSYKYDEDSVFRQVASHCAKPLRSTPVACDLPRLVSKIRVIKDGSLVFDPTQDEVLRTKAKLTYEFLLALADAMNLPKVGHDLRFNRGWSVMDPDRLPAELNTLLEQLLPHGCALVDVLKACTQGALAPPAIALKQLTQPVLQYKDKRGGWEIDVCVDGGSEIRVEHRKAEVSWDWHIQEPRDGPRVQFGWSLFLFLSHLPEELKLESAQVQVTEVHVFPHGDTNTSRQLYAALDPVLHLRQRPVHMKKLSRASSS